MDPFTLAVKAHHVHFTNSFSTESSISKHRLTKSLGIPKPSPPLTFLTRISGFRHFNSIDLLRNSGSKVVEGLRFDGPVMDVDEIMDCEEGDLVVETSITRTLPPALTLEHGLESISEAVNKLKTDPPSSSSGVLRFQVAVPPSAKALDWFCRQPESSEVFPVFFLSRDMENPTSKSLYLNQNRGVFGIGAAVYFTHPAWCDSEERTKPKRYLSTNPIPITTYGFMDINFNTEPSCIKHEAGSFYFFVPQIELRELDDISILAATLAWSNGMVCTFEQAIQSFESSFCQVSSHFCSSTERYNPRYVRSALTKFNMMEDKTVQMVCMNAITLGRRDFGCDFMEMVSSFS